MKNQLNLIWYQQLKALTLGIHCGVTMKIALMNFLQPTVLWSAILTGILVAVTSVCVVGQALKPIIYNSSHLYALRQLNKLYINTIQKV